MVNKKSRDARTQLHVWSKLLEGRIALQKVATSIREFEKLSIDPVAADQGQEETQRIITPADDTTIKSVNKLLTCLVRLRDTYRAKSQFCTVADADRLPAALKDANNEDAEDSELPADTNVDRLLTRKHEDYNDVRNEMIEKWCEKTKIGTIPKKGYVALELPTLQLISNAIKDKDRLIKRTQLDRTSHLDDAYDTETFNDDDFYHILLKEMISKDEGRKWVELQRQRYKSKRKAETKATKGRKIKKDLIPKLVNFMAPSRPANMRDKETIPDQIRNELMKSLFGGSVTTRAE